MSSARRRTAPRRSREATPESARELAGSRAPGPRGPDAIGLALVLLLAAGCRDRSAPPPDERFTTDPAVVATYDGGVIMAAELDAVLLEAAPAERRPAEGESVEAWVERHARRIFGERALLDSEPASTEATDDGARERLESAIRSAQARTFLERKNERFEVIEAEAKELFDREIGGVTLPERRAFRNLLVAPRPDESGNEGARARAEELRRRVAAGESFPELARVHSASANAAVGGMVAAVDRGALRGEVAELIFSLSIGELSPVVCAAAGCMLFEVDQIIPPIRPEFGHHRDRLLERIAGERRRAWWSGVLQEEARRQGAELPSWIGDVVAPKLPPDSEVARFGDRPILGRDLLGNAAGPDPVDRLRALATERLLSAALERDAPEVAATVRARTERAVRLDAVVRRQIAARAFGESEEPLRRAYEARRESYRTDPQLEVTIFASRIEPGDPIAQAARLSDFARRLEREPKAAESADALAALQLERERLPRRSARELAATRPDLAVALLGELVEGRIIGPFRFSDTLRLVRFDVVIPERTLSYLEARDRVRADFLNRESGRIRDEIVEQLARARRFTVSPEGARRFGATTISPASGPAAESP